MCKALTAVLVLALLVGSVRVAPAQEYAPDEIIVGYRVGATAEEKAAIEAAHDLTLLADFSHINARHYRIPPGRTVEDTVRALQSSAIVQYAEPNYVRRFQAAPLDPRFPEQWYLSNTGQVVNGASGSPGEDINWLPAMDLFSGTREVLVAVVDSGVAVDHPELSGRFWINARETLNGTDDDRNSYVDDIIGWDFFDRDGVPLDENGHGTLVASLIAAARDNGHGGAGVSPTARVMALRVSNDFGALGPSTANVISAFTYAGVRGARIINASFGGPGYSAALHATVQWLNSKGVLLIAAAGNGGGDYVGDNNDATPEYPASHPVPNVIAVAATAPSGALARFSNYGAASVHIAAPGVDMLGASVRRTVTFIEEFAAGAPGWTTGVTPSSWYNALWSIYTDAIGRHWAVDSEGPYLPNVNSWLMSPPIATGVLGTQLRYGRALYLASSGDCFWVEISTNSGTTWSLLPGALPSCGPMSWPPAVRRFDLSQYDGQTIRLRFRFVSDGFLGADGVYLDWVEISNVQPFFYDGTQYRYGSGTSFAAPLVAGAAALVWSQRPDLTVSQVRQIILGSARADPGLTGKVSSGGKLDVFAALQAAITTAPGLMLSADAIDFGWQAVGFAGPPQTITLRNAAGGPVRIAGLTTSNAAVFPSSHNCPTSLPAGGACTLSVTFVPNAYGEVPGGGVISIASDAPGSPHVVNVIGVGVAPASSAVPVRGDFDGDRKDDLASWRPTDGAWSILDSRTGVNRVVGWGGPGDVPVPGDYDGDGRTDIAVFRPSTGAWFIVDSSTGTGRGVGWGAPGDAVAPGDYNGDRRTDIAVFRPSTGQFLIRPPGP